MSMMSVAFSLTEVGVGRQSAICLVNPVDLLMDRYARGDAAAFPELHRAVAPRVVGFLHRLAGNPTVAADLAQETFARMHRARGAFVAGAPALPWIYTIARNTFLDDRRKRAMRSIVVSDEALAEAQPDVPGTRPDRQFEARETLGRVRAALATMSVPQREAFILVRFEGFSLRDAAEVLGTSEASVKARAFRAYEALRQAMADVEPASTPASSRGEA